MTDDEVSALVLVSSCYFRDGDLDPAYRDHWLAVGDEVLARAAADRGAVVDGPARYRVVGGDEWTITTVAGEPIIDPGSTWVDQVPLYFTAPARPR